jgi:hypothetical protein
MNKREKLLKLIKLSQEQGIVPADAIIELGKLNTQALIDEIQKIPELWDAAKLSGVIPADQLPLYTLTEPGIVPPPFEKELILGSNGWEKKPSTTTNVQVIGGRGGGGGMGPPGPPGTPANPLDIYPVGSLYISTVNVNPAIYFGGTWVLYGSGMILMGF